MLKIKVCGLREASNIVAIDALEPDYLGFIFYPFSPRYIESDMVLPETQASKVGVFVNASVETMLHLSAEYNLETIQLHGNEPESVCGELVSAGFEVIKAFHLDANVDFRTIERYRQHCTYFLYEAKNMTYGGSGKKFNWNLLRQINDLGPFFLSGGLGPADAETICLMKWENMMGVDINSKFETRPGKKNIQLVKDFLSKMQNNGTERKL